eukprot:6824533-Prorocentrum_lima.AAC.1
MGLQVGKLGAKATSATKPNSRTTLLRRLLLLPLLPTTTAAAAATTTTRTTARAPNTKVVTKRVQVGVGT